MLRPCISFRSLFGCGDKTLGFSKFSSLKKLKTSRIWFSLSIEAFSPFYRPCPSGKGGPRPAGSLTAASLYENLRFSFRAAATQYCTNCQTLQISHFPQGCKIRSAARRRLSMWDSAMQSADICETLFKIISRWQIRVCSVSPQVSFLWSLCLYYVQMYYYSIINPALQAEEKWSPVVCRPGETRISLVLLSQCPPKSSK